MAGSSSALAESGSSVELRSLSERSSTQKPSKDKTHCDFHECFLVSRRPISKSRVGVDCEMSRSWLVDSQLRCG